MVGYNVENIGRLLSETFSKEQLVAHASGMTFWLRDPEILHEDKELLAAMMAQYAASRVTAYPTSLVEELLHWARMNAAPAVYEKYEPYYPQAGPHRVKPLHLVRLCLRLAWDLSTYELRAVCRWLRVDPDAFGLAAHPPTIEEIISLVNFFDKHALMDELIAACESLRPGIGDGLAVESP